MRIEIKSYWHTKKGKIKELYPFIKDSDLKYRLGEEKQMIEMLSNKLGKSYQELLQMIVTI